MALSVVWRETAIQLEPAAGGSSWHTLKTSLMTLTMLQLLLRTADQFPGQDFPCLR